MRPNFALKLSHDGIGLLLRATGGWRIVGEVSLDDPDLAPTLRYLRQSAAELAGGHFATKLIIPNSQILFRDIWAPGDTPGARRVAIRAALDGTTPYALDELAFDWSDAGDGMAKVAVAASITLEEAEAFATEHCFNPVSFVAIPEPGDFTGEPWFGTTRLAKGLLTGGDTIERDSAAVKIVGPVEAVTPAAAPVVLAEAIPLDPVDSADESVAETADVEGSNGDVPDDREAPEQPPNNPQPSVAVEDPAPTPATATEPQPSAVAFSTSRAGEDTDIAPLRLESIAPRIALQPGGGQAETNDILPTLGGVQREVEVTHLSVTAPEVVGDKDDTKPLVKPKPASPTTSKLNAALSSIKSKPREPSQTAAKLDSPPFTLSSETTVFGARKPALPRRQRRYLGLILTLALIVALLVAGLLSDLVVGEQTVLSRLIGPRQPEVSEVITEPVPPVADPVEAIPVAPAPAQSAEISLEEAEAFHVRTGLWPFSPTAPIDPDSDRIDDLYVASIDPVVVSHDAVALPDVDLEDSDATLPAMGSPPPAGAVFDLDEDGLVRALPEGALTPDGVMVFAGKPAQVPAPRPVGAVQEPAGQTERLTGFRPRTRPDNLSEENERARLGGRTLSQLAAIRPEPRPASAQDGDANADTAPTKLAVLRSPTPASRPSTFSRIVEQAVAEAQASTSQATDEVEEADAEPEVTSVAAVAAPKLPPSPTRANVAKEATVKNAINLGKINLIGVYGSSSNRRALIRLSSGRYVKVRVGDRVDGGQVAAISSSEVLYIKSGRKVTLAMPKG